MENQLKVAGMSCMHCVNSIKDTLMDLDGIKTVDVDLENGYVKISGDDYNMEEIKQAITDIGFIPED